MRKTKLTFLIPVYNEELSLPQFQKNLHSLIKTLNYETEVIFIDDGSQDNSVKLLTDKHKLGWKILKHERNLGHQEAMLTGLKEARGEYIIMLDSDGQHPLSEIPKMLSLAEANNYEVVQGIRRDRLGDTFFKKATARIFYYLIQKITSVKIRNNSADFRLISKKVKTAVLGLSNPLPLRMSIPSLEFSTNYFPFDVSERQFGESKYSTQKMFDLAIASALRFSKRPLLILTVIGTVSATLAFLWLIIVIAFYFTGKNLPGWSSLAALILFFGGINLLSIGTLAFYVGDIHDKISKKR